MLLPLVEPDGRTRSPAVHPGESAKRFQVLARAASETGCDLLAPTDGRVLGHTGAPTPEGWCDHAVELRCDTESTTTNVIREAPQAAAPTESDELLEFARRLGLVDLTAGKPLCATLTEAAECGIDHLVINALDPLPECLWHSELLRLSGRSIADAGALVANLMRIPNVHVVTPTHAAVPPLRTAARSRVVAMANRYPFAHPRLVASALFGDRFPYDRPLTAAGVLVLDVQTLYALGDALAAGQPFTWRWVIVGGDAVERPGLYRAFIGTRVADVLAAAGPVDRVSAVVAGGLLSGAPVTSPDCIVSATSVAFHFLTDAVAKQPSPTECVRCGFCIESCPVNIDPRAIFHTLQVERAAVPAKLHACACIDCGLCSYVCPSELDLAHAVRTAKRLANGGRAAAGVRAS